MNTPNREALERIVDRDSKHLSPSERAERVVSLVARNFGVENAEAFVKNPLYWDLICFSVEMLGALSLSLEDDLFTQNIILASQKVFSIHYSVEDGNEILGPSREEHEEVWDEATLPTEAP